MSPKKKINVFKKVGGVCLGAMFNFDKCCVTFPPFPSSHTPFKNEVVLPKMYTWKGQGSSHRFDHHWVVVSGIASGVGLRPRFWCLFLPFVVFFLSTHPSVPFSFQSPQSHVCWWEQVVLPREALCNCKTRSAGVAASLPLPDVAVRTLCHNSFLVITTPGNWEVAPLQYLLYIQSSGQ